LTWILRQNVARAGRAVYGSRGTARVASTIALAASIAAIVLAYRFTLRIVTLYTTS